jgi:hypothetical protein
MDIPSWSFTNIGKSMMTSSCIIEHKIIKKPENPPETTHSDKPDEFTPKTQIVLIKESANPPETTNYDTITDFILNFINLGFEINLELIIELYI